MPLEIGMPLPVEIVDQTGQPPALLVRPALARIGAHAGFDRVAVLAQIDVLDPLVEQSQRLLAGREG